MLAVSIVGLCIPLSGIIGRAVDESITHPIADDPSQRVFVREFRFQGNRVFSTELLTSILSQYRGTNLPLVQLDVARQTLNEFYRNHGYTTSGALPDVGFADGVVTFTIVEAPLAQLQIFGIQRLTTNFIYGRLALAARPPLNTNRLTEALQRLEGNPNIRSIRARLDPTGDSPGASVLKVHVEEANPFSLQLIGHNGRPPSVGAEALDAQFVDYNLTHHSDRFLMDYGILHRSKHGVEMSGIDNLGLSYAVPISVYDTSLDLFYRQNDYSVMEEPFDRLNIESKEKAYGIGLTQPAYESRNVDFSASIRLDRHYSESFLDGERFSFSPGAKNGELNVTVLRIGPEITWRDARQVFAARVVGNAGLEPFGTPSTTADGKRVPDGTFFSFVNQFQYVRRLLSTVNDVPFHKSFILLQGTYQWANEPLPTFEQLSLGGAGSVRGYRENQFLRDNGLLFTAAIHIPIIATSRSPELLRIVPFYDFGNGWNVDSTAPSELISSLGLGLKLNYRGRLQARLDWAHRFQHVATSGNDLQDDGIHFRVIWKIF